MKKILILGHSHVVALKQVKKYHKLFEIHHLPDNDTDIDIFLSTLKTDNYLSVIFLIGGNYHNVFSIVKFPSPFDFYLPEQLNLPILPDARILPVNLVAKVFQGLHMNDMFNLTAKLAQLFKNNKMYQIESPPPLPEIQIRKYPGTFKAKINRLGISSERFRYKLWRLHSKTVQAACEKRGISWIEVPKESQRSDGLLAQKYCHLDPTHGNRLYGELVLKQILALHQIDITQALL